MKKIVIALGLLCVGSIYAMDIDEGYRTDPQAEEAPQIWLAAAEGNVGEVKRLIAAGKDVNEPEPQHRLSPLLAAASRAFQKNNPKYEDYKAIVILLLDAGADPEVGGAPGSLSQMLPVSVSEEVRTAIRKKLEQMRAR